MIGKNYEKFVRFLGKYRLYILYSWFFKDYF